MASASASVSATKKVASTKKKVSFADECFSKPEVEKNSDVPLEKRFAEPEVEKNSEMSWYQRHAEHQFILHFKEPLDQRMLEYLVLYHKIYEEWMQFVSEQLMIKVTKPHQKLVMALRYRKNEFHKELNQHPDMSPVLRKLVNDSIQLIVNAIKKANDDWERDIATFEHNSEVFSFHQSHPVADRIWRISKKHGFSLELNSYNAYIKTIGHATSYFQYQTRMYGWSEKESFHVLC